VPDQRNIKDRAIGAREAEPNCCARFTLNDHPVNPETNRAIRGRARNSSTRFSQTLGDGLSVNCQHDHSQLDTRASRIRIGFNPDDDRTSPLRQNRQSSANSLQRFVHDAVRV
jgi:hypothetical protein